MKKLIFCFALFSLVAFFFSCTSTRKESLDTNVRDTGNVDTIVRGTGNVLGSVTATSSVSEDRRTGETTGDTLKYGYIVSGNGKDNSQVERLAANSLTNATEKAYANALYEIIAQAKKMGGNALNEVVSSNKRSFDLSRNTETVTVTITAEVIGNK